MVRSSGLEPPTSRLSGVCSNQLSYERIRNRIRTTRVLLRKEVIHPHVPVRIPCYDFTPIANHTLGASFPKVRPATSGATHRSEEHTSELQSRQYLVCRLLLEKKNKKLTNLLKDVICLLHDTTVDYCSINSN